MGFPIVGGVKAFSQVTVEVDGGYKTVCMGGLDLEAAPVTIHFSGDADLCPHPGFIPQFQQAT